MRYKRILLYILMLISTCLLLSCGNKDINTKEGGSYEVGDYEEEAMVESAGVEGADALAGTWYVKSVYYDHKLIDVQEIDALVDLYDSTFLTFNDKGTFFYIDIVSHMGKYGVDNCGVDWNEQAVKKAEDYLEYTAFSYSGLIEQLEYEGFTRSQAEYGASKVY